MYRLDPHGSGTFAWIRIRILTWLSLLWPVLRSRSRYFLVGAGPGEKKVPGARACQNRTGSATLRMAYANKHSWAQLTYKITSVIR